jgi:hypothetical protein
MAENDKVKIALEDMEKQNQGVGSVGPAPNSSGAQSATDVSSLPLNQGDTIHKLGKRRKG